VGMFDRDKEIGVILTSYMKERENFILWDAGIIREDFPTNIGPAAQTGLTVSRMSDPGDRVTVTTLASAIAGKAREANPSDFPAVVYWAAVWSDKWNRNITVLQFVKAYDAGAESRQTSPQTGNSGGYKQASLDADSSPASVPADDLPF